MQINRPTLDNSRVSSRLSPSVAPTTMPRKPKPTEQPMPPEGASYEVPEAAIGSRIRASREARGWSQSALADHSKELDPARKGVSRTVLVGYEAGNFRPGAREIRILCETLGITPNWLIYGDEDFAGGTGQTSMEAARKNGLFAAMRIALSIAMLKPHERNAIQSLVLSMAGRELGDRKLSILFFLAAGIAGPGFEMLKKELDDPDLMAKDVRDVVVEMLAKYNESHLQWGHKLQFNEDGSISGDWLYPEPEPAE
jgi:transcriptional regulator with XRE-family HTH domain